MNILKSAKSLGHPRHWLQDDLLRRLFKNAAVLFSGNVGASLLGLASLALTARALGVEQFGILVLITTYVVIVDRLVNFQTWQAMIKYGADALEEKRQEDFRSLLKFGFSLDISTAILGTITAASVVWIVGQWRGWDEQHILMASIYSITILFHINGTPTAILRLYDRFKKIALQHVISAGLKLIGVFFAFISGAGLWTFLAIWAVVDILGKGILIYFALQEMRLQQVGSITKSSINGISKKFEGIWGFVWTTNVNSSIRMSTREIDVMIVAGILGPMAVGLYKVAKQFTLVIQKTVDPLYQAIYPEFAKLYSQGAINKFIKFGVRSSLMAGFISVFIWLFFFLFSDYIYIYTVGADFLDAIPVMLWYMLAIVVASFAFPLQPAMLSMGLPHTTFWVHIGSTVVYYAALYWFLPLFGLIGAGISYLAYYLFWSASMLVIEMIILSRNKTYDEKAILVTKTN